MYNCAIQQCATSEQMDSYVDITTAKLILTKLPAPLQQIIRNFILYAEKRTQSMMTLLFYH